MAPLLNEQERQELQKSFAERKKEFDRAIQDDERNYLAIFGDLPREKPTEKATARRQKRK